jgi:hypothetical protein
MLDDYDDGNEIYDNFQNAEMTEVPTEAVQSFDESNNNIPVFSDTSFNPNDFVEIEIYAEDAAEFKKACQSLEESNATCDETLINIEQAKFNQATDVCETKEDDMTKTSATEESNTLVANINYNEVANLNYIEESEETLPTQNEHVDVNNNHDDKTTPDKDIILEREGDIPTLSPKRSRSRTKQIDSWKKNIRKRRRQAGLEYISSRGTLMAKKLKQNHKDCKGKCRYACSWSFSNEDTDNIHSEFWSHDDDTKMLFYAETTERILKGTKGNKKRTAGNNTSKEENTKNDSKSRRKYTFQYFFRKGSEKIRVCQDFYRGVLGINISRVRKYYEKLDKKTELKDMRGRNTTSRISENDIEFVREHIRSFNKVPSHYCRSKSIKEYLESNLNRTKMYELYKAECAKCDRNPVKFSKYRDIFNKDFNLSFHIPKKDRCDLCEEIETKAKNKETVNEQTRAKFEKHKSDKGDTKTERDTDRNLDDPTTATICFDLENVIALPRADISNFFYKRKLNTYNLTAHCSVDKAVYNAIWTEADAGRGGNEIASALVNILHEINSVHPGIKNYILWSDACVPQNRNSIMTFALKTFMNTHNIHSITQKFGCPGHSAIQEVDNAHSNIEKALKCSEVFSPVSLVRVLKSIDARRKGPFKVIQMRPPHFYDYQKVTNTLNFGSVPYTKVKCLKYSRNDKMGISFKLSFTEQEFGHGVILTGSATRNARQCLSLPIPLPVSSHKKPVISSLKKKDLTSMLKYMSQIDSQYYMAKGLIIT